MEGEGNGAPEVPTAPPVPSDVAALVETKVDPVTPKLAEPTMPPPTPPKPRSKVDTDPGTPFWWYVGLGAVVVGLGIVLYIELRDRFGKKDG
jgi:hypothetical protein